MHATGAGVWLPLPLLLLAPPFPLLLIPDCAGESK
jgi:hypothetical protein